MNKKEKSQIGWATTVALLIIGTALWLLSKPANFSFMDSPWRYLGQITGILGTILLSLEYLLATRAKIFEKVFSGLDRAYIAHRLLGGIGFALILYHPLFLSLNSPTLLNSLKLHFLPGEIFSYNLGIVALYIYAALIFLTVYIKLPYEIWRKTHIFMGVPLLIAAYHIMIIGSDIKNYLPLKIFIFTMVSVAVTSFIYKRFLYEKFSEHYKYKIVGILTLGEIIEISMEPVGKPMEFTSGQYIFAKFNSADVSDELHPFSISSSPTETVLRLSIKKLGDFTKSIINLTVETTVTVYGPHGEFGIKSLESTKSEIWIAGGIGVTPFLSLLRYYGANKSEKNIEFIYCVGSENEFAYKKEINSIIPETKNIKATFYSSSENGYINVEKIEKISDGLQGKKIFLCGPRPMMLSLISALEAKKIHPRNIIFEDFSFIE